MNTLKFTVLALCLFQSVSAGSIFNHMLVANRSSGSITRISLPSNSVQHFSLPTAANPSEPMYISYSPDNERVYVGDRANNRLVVYNPTDYSTPLGEVTVGAGIFHMWGDRNHNQLWVNNDIDKTVSVVDMLNASVITTIATPVDLGDLGGKPHDVFINPNEPYAYVTMLGVAGDSDWIIRYSTETFLETGRVAVGNDPHVSFSPSRDFIYAPTQGGNGVYVIDADLFEVVDIIDVPNSHGAWLSGDQGTFYTTNIGDLGSGGLVSIDATSLVVNDSVDVPNTIPHNVITTPDDRLVYLTHSGATNNQVSIFDVSDPTNPIYLSSVTTEFNPYGIALISNVPEPSGNMAMLLLFIGWAANRRPKK